MICLQANLAAVTKFKNFAIIGVHALLYWGTDTCVHFCPPVHMHSGLLTLVGIAKSCTFCLACFDLLSILPTHLGS